MIINPHKRGYDPKGLLIGNLREDEPTFE